MIKLTDEQCDELGVERGSKLKSSLILRGRDRSALYDVEPPEKKKWKPQGGWWYVTDNGEVYDCYPDAAYKTFGTAYPTKKAAEKAAEAMRKHNRLLAYVSEFDAGWEADWDDDNQFKYYVYYGYPSKGWHVGQCCVTEVAGRVYMSEQCAEGLAEKLNSGEVEL